MDERKAAPALDNYIYMIHHLVNDEGGGLVYHLVNERGLSRLPFGERVVYHLVNERLFQGTG